MAIQFGATIYDLEESELCYAPQFGSAKDPVNFAGMVAADVLRGDMPLRHWDSAEKGFLLDVREPVELAVETVQGAVNIRWASYGHVRGTARDRDIICRPAQRAYYARASSAERTPARSIPGMLPRDAGSVRTSAA
jgi:hypothetical protein